MMKESRSSIIIFGFVAVFAFINFASTTGKQQQENHAPVVKIVSPKNNCEFDWNSQLIYSVTVSDKEDGESKYDEINTKEVLLEVKFIDDNSKLEQALRKSLQNDPPGLAFIRTSNCFNCHAFDSKSIGPSFYDISKKYKPTPQNIALLVKHTREGSTGIWGKASMPTHTELTKEETKKMIEWIFQNARATNSNYYVGLEGSFRIKPNVTSRNKVAYILIASYTDHGAKGVARQRLKGQDMIVIHSK